MEQHHYLFHVRQTLKLAVPVMLSMAGQTMVMTADNLMVGNVTIDQVGYGGNQALAAVAFASSVFTNVFMLGIGFSIGLTQMVGAAYGRKDRTAIGQLFRHGLMLDLLIGLLGCVLLLTIEPLLWHMGQVPRVVELCLPYYRQLAFNMPLIMVFFGFKQFAEGVSSTLPAMVFMLAGNAINIFLNWVLIYGHLGFEPMGITGAGWATIISRVFQMVGFGSYVLTAKYFRQFLESFWEGMTFTKGMILDIAKLSTPIGFQMLLEAGAFTIGSIMIGTFGEAALSSQQIALNVVSITFMTASGVASAATIRVSQAFGRGNFGELNKAASTSFWIVMSFMSVTGILIYWLRYQLPEWFVSGESSREVVSVAASLLVVAAVFQFFDGLQLVMMSILRGVADTKIPTMIAVVAYWGISLGGGYLLAFSLGFGPVGIWYGYLVGLGFAGVMFFFRFRYLQRYQLVG